MGAEVLAAMDRVDDAAVRARLTRDLAELNAEINELERLLNAAPSPHYDPDRRGFYRRRLHHWLDRATALRERLVREYDR
jgi:hypothetical protein